MRLSDWRSANGKTQADVAALTGISQGLISRYERGEVRPQVENVLRIEWATNGAVTLQDWYPQPPQPGQGT